MQISKFSIISQRHASVRQKKNMDLANHRAVLKSSDQTTAFVRNSYYCPT